MSNNSSMNPEAPFVAVIGDLTSLYYAKSDRDLNKSINYIEFDAALKWKFGVNEFGINKHYTLFDEKNVGQGKFLDTLNNLGWEVETFKPSDVLTNLQFERRDSINLREYRFTPELNFWLGEADGSYDTLVLITDQFASIHRQIREVVKNDDRIKIYVVAFNKALDKRYFSADNKDKNGKDIAHFLDIESIISDFRNSNEYPNS